MTRKNIKIRIICDNTDGEMIAKAVENGLRLAGLEPLESPKFHPSRKSDTDTLIYQDFIKPNRKSS